jgi:RNA polymerase sigma factor (sigma-70 family)
MTSTESHQGEPQEPDRLAHLYADHIQRARALARALTGDNQLAEDFAQDAFIATAGRFHHLRKPDAFDAYLRKAVVNRCRQHFRRARLERESVRAFDRGAGHPESGSSFEDRDELWITIQRLPYRQRAAIVLRYYEDLSESGVGEVLRCSRRAVNSLISRAMATLREQVGHERSEL